jgi:hypothetical protein
MKKLFVAFALMVLIGLSKLSAQQPSRSASISGFIQDKNSEKPIEFATVSLRNEKDSSLITGTISDIDGAFTIPVRGPGKFYIEVDFMGVYQN